MEVLSNIPFELDVSALMQMAHIQSESEDAVDFERLVSRAREVGNPKALYDERFIDGKGAETITAGGITFTSRALRVNLDSVERVFPFVVTCGRELDGIELSAGDMLQEFWLDTIKAVLLGAAIGPLTEHISQRYRLARTATMSPGSGDVDVWPIEEQRPLFAMLGDVESAIGVKLTESFLMIPNKSVSGIYFPTETDFHTCQVCHRENCPSRRAPFDKGLWESLQEG